MALKHGSQSGTDVREFTDIIRGFEEMNGCVVILHARMVRFRAGHELYWTAQAWDKAPEEVGAKHLASASVRCSEKRLSTMEGVLLNLMYMLDGQLAWQEMSGKPNNA